MSPKIPLLDSLKAYDTLQTEKYLVMYSLFYRNIHRAIYPELIKMAKFIFGFEDSQG